MVDANINLWRPSASRLALESRARMLGDIRGFFRNRKVLEVETPTLSRARNSDPNIRTMMVEDCPTPYLRSSPEYALKRLLAAGVGDLYEMGRVYRRGEAGAMHNPEFTLLEWYRLGWDYLDLAEEVIELIRHCGQGQFSEWQTQALTYRNLFQQSLGLDPMQCDESDLADCAADRGIIVGPAEQQLTQQLEQQAWLDLLLAEVIQPQFDPETFTVVYEFPPEQAALSRVTAGPDPVAQRFEVFAGPVELANGYQELDDPLEQRARFERENRLRAIRGEATGPLDTKLIAALENGLPDCAGVALGVDRMLMLTLGVDHIQMVLAFDSDRV